MGHGRTGMVLAMYLMLFENLDPYLAIKKVRSIRKFLNILILIGHCYVKTISNMKEIIFYNLHNITLYFSSLNVTLIYAKR